MKTAAAASQPLTDGHLMSHHMHQQHHRHVLTYTATHFTATTASAFSTRHMHCMIMLALPVTFLTLILTLAADHDERDLCIVSVVLASLTYSHSLTQSFSPHMHSVSA